MSRSAQAALVASSVLALAGHSHADDWYSATQRSDAGACEWVHPENNLVIGRDLDSTEKPFKKRAPAAFSYKSDNETGAEEYGIKAIVLVRDMFGHPKPRGRECIDAGRWVPAVSPFVALDRQSSAAASKNIDDLTVGVSALWYAPWNKPVYLSEIGRAHV